MNLLHTFTGMSWPGIAATPVMKSEVIKVRITIDLWQDGWILFSTTRSKCMGTKTMGIWLMQDNMSTKKKILLIY